MLVQISLDGISLGAGVINDQRHLLAIPRGHLLCEAPRYHGADLNDPFEQPPEEDVGEVDILRVFDVFIAVLWARSCIYEKQLCGAVFKLASQLAAAHWDEICFGCHFHVLRLNAGLNLTEFEGSQDLNSCCMQEEGGAS